ncbi:MAG: sigma 54-interacting transcriptional regulator [Candidatus Schekmanbacteria bacterium]|nr:sigma 54-interacting transcriptional regulator [Candidatus Schekmanbacteria bacterium]
MRGNSSSRDKAAASHLRVLRYLLGRDYLKRADWSFALRDLAQMVKEALGAQEAFVALFDSAATGWSATTAEGDQLGDEEIGARASRTVLEQVRTQVEPILGSLPPSVTSESILVNQLDSVLAIPIHWWDVKAEQPTRRFGGCLYAHRSSPQPSFSEADIALALDICEIAQRSLNILRYLRRVESDLESSELELQRHRQRTAVEYRLGAYATRDPYFAETVLEPLKRVSGADKIGLLILGPTGAGKTFLAEAYHYECARRNGPFVVLDCSQVTSGETLSAELFGYAPHSGFANSPAKGSVGAAERADKGTLFIDEISCLPPDLQQRLLGLSHSGSFQPLGGAERKHVDIQIIAATNENLRDLVAQRRFREDLFWRISEVTIELPPLSSRAADIPDLAARMFDKARDRFGRTDLSGFSGAALDVLRNHDWSRAGNIRGLEHTVRRSVLLAPPGIGQLSGEHVKFDAVHPGTAQSGRQLGAPAQGKAGAPASEDDYAPEVREAIEAVRRHGHGTAAARELGISYAALIGRLRKAGLAVRKVRVQSFDS